jgi:hypothetical protein
MKIDETFEGVNRLWQEISVIVLIHAVAVALAMYAHLIPIRTVSEGIGAFTTLPELTTVRANLQRIGLDLPFVVITGIIVYIVLFQKFSEAAVGIAVFRLSHSEPALWRAGKCFDELRQLVQFFEGYTVSTELTDLEVTLGLAVTQYAKDYKEHHRQLVDARLAMAALWARYYAGFCFLAFASILFIAAHHPTARSLILPGGLFLAALFIRCGWETQIENAVLGRLRFAIDCATISGAKRKDERITPEREAEWDGARSKYKANRPDTGNAGQSERPSRLELELAASLVMLPPPGLPYEHFWVLHFVRQLRPFKNAGSLALVRNERFRDWLHEAFGIEDFCSDAGRDPAEWLTYRIAWPDPAPDRRILARLLRTNAWGRIGRWLAPQLLLVDRPEKYWNRRTDIGNPDFLRNKSLRKWLVRIGRP